MSKQKQGISRRSVLKGGAAAAASIPMFYIKGARAADIIVVRDPGGVWAEAARKGFYEAFIRETGIQVAQVTAGHEPIAQVKAMVDSESYLWDVVALTISNAGLLGPEGYLEEIDHSAPHMDALIEKARSKWFMGTDVYANALAYRTDTLKKGPDNWADFLNVEEFKGRRAMRKHAIDTLEQALLADGVSPKDLYPLDVERAFAKLDTIKEEIAIWWTGGAQASQLLKSGEVDMLGTWNGRSQAAIDAGAPARIVWNQALYSIEGWTIPKGNPKTELAMKLVQFCARPDRQAEFAKYISYGPTNPNAYDNIAAERAAVLPTSPDHFDNLIFQSNDYWVSNQEPMVERFNQWLLT